MAISFLIPDFLVTLLLHYFIWSGTLVQNSVLWELHFVNSLPIEKNVPAHFVILLTLSYTAEHCVSEMWKTNLNCFGQVFILFINLFILVYQLHFKLTYQATGTPNHWSLKQFLSCIINRWVRSDFYFCKCFHLKWTSIEMCSLLINMVWFKLLVQILVKCAY